VARSTARSGAHPAPSRSAPEQERRLVPPARARGRNEHGPCCAALITAPLGKTSPPPELRRLNVLTTFTALGVIPEIADALATEGITSPFPIQSLALPIALGGQDIIGQARTGTGKTLAFGIPLLQRITHGGKVPQGLVVVPTRELAIQVHDDLVLAGGKLGTRVLSVYGGRAYEPQIEALREGVDVVVGTPGRMLDLVKQRHLDLSQVSVLVLDEGDRMLDLGFLPDIERIISKVPEQRQTMLFSATMPGEIVGLSRRYLTRPTNVRAESHAESEAQPKVVQHVWQAHQMDKPELVARILQAEGRGLTMVFCQTKRTCDRLATDLAERGFAVAAVHGDLGQGQRERALRAFRHGKIDVLIATDVAARGLDIDDVTHVINYECPEDDKAHVHRIGRTGRAGHEGIAVTLVDWSDLQRWKLINKALDLGFADPEETYSTSDHLFEALNIPKTVKGTLPKDQRGREGLAAEALEDIGETGRQRTPKATRPSAEEEERPARKRRQRTRTRTRRGLPVEGAETAPADGAQTSAPEAPQARDAEESAKGAPRRRTRTRTRRRPAEGSGGAGQEGQTAETA
jgi:superfamily II DNA/RNA helicase